MSKENRQNSKPKVGLLPLYIELYDKSMPQMREGISAFLQQINSALQQHGLEVLQSDICCVKEQFEQAITLFEKNNADLIVTLHLAYSPSLESAEVLCSTALPIFVLDTTPSFSFDISASEEDILYNHGIHGVQDLCSMLKRGGKDFHIFAGHYEHSSVCKRLAQGAKALKAATSLSGMNVGVIGKPFEGMGDFVCTPAGLDRLGIKTKICQGAQLQDLYQTVTEQEIQAEYQKDQKSCVMDGISYEQYQKTERVALAVRKWIAQNNLKAFSINFEWAGQLPGLKTMPFSEAGKQMAAGVGYAGEGDVLTAALVGSLLCQFSQTGFVEMFCPDWKGGSVFLSHMGEVNHSLIDHKRMLIKEFAFGNADNPTFITGTMMPGSACIVNIAPGAGDSFELIVAPGTMLEADTRSTALANCVSGWFKPQTPLQNFLENYSLAGGTHHCALVYNVTPDTLKVYAKALNINCIVI